MIHYKHGNRPFCWFQLQPKLFLNRYIKRRDSGPTSTFACFRFTILCTRIVNREAVFAFKASMIYDGSTEPPSQHVCDH